MTRARQECISWWIVKINLIINTLLGILGAGYSLGCCRTTTMAKFSFVIIPWMLLANCFETSGSLNLGIRDMFSLAIHPSHMTHVIRPHKYENLHNFVSQVVHHRDNVHMHNTNDQHHDDPAKLVDYEKNEFASKTVTLKVTKRVTVNPVCITIRRDKPPCYNNRVIYDGEYHPHDDTSRNVRKIRQETFATNSDFFLEKSNIESSELKSSLHVEEGPQTFLGKEDLEVHIHNIEISSPIEEDNFEAHAIDSLHTKSTFKDSLLFKDQNIDTATARLVLIPHTIKEQNANDDFGSYKSEDEHEIEVTRTIWATEVQTFTNYEITATLAIDNCVPYDLTIPHCTEVQPQQAGHGKHKQKKSDSPEVSSQSSHDKEKQIDSSGDPFSIDIRIKDVKDT